MRPKNAGRNLLLKIALQAGDAVCGSGEVEFRSKLRHAIGDGHDGAQGRYPAGDTEEPHERLAQSPKLVLNRCVSIESEDLLGLVAALGFDDRLEQLLLASEVDVQCALGDPGFARDRTHAGSVEALR